MIPKHFSIEELVDKETFARFGHSSEWFLDYTTVQLLSQFRERYGSTTVNDWPWGGKLQYRGFRPPQCTVGGKYSQHRFGRAFDINCKGATPDEIREDIMKNEQFWLGQGLTTIEDGKFSRTWVHFDTRHTGLNKIFIVKP